MTIEYRADLAEQKLDEADCAAKTSELRYTGEEVFRRVRDRILTAKGGDTHAE